MHIERNKTLKVMFNSNWCASNFYYGSLQQIIQWPNGYILDRIFIAASLIANVLYFWPFKLYICVCMQFRLVLPKLHGMHGTIKAIYLGNTAC